MSATENFMKMQGVIRGIYACCRSTVTIEIKSENCRDDAVNAALQRLLHERKEVAKAYAEAEFNNDKQMQLIDLFSMYNNEIIKIVGLYTS